MVFLNKFYLDGLNVIKRDGNIIAFDIGKEWKSSCSFRFHHSELYLITKGSCVINIEGKDYHATEGSCFFIPAGTLYDYHSDTREVFEQVYIHFDFFPEDSHIFHLLNLPYMLEATEKSKLYNMFFEFASLVNSEDITDRIRIKAVILGILSEYISLSGVDRVAISGRNDECMNNILNYINSHLDGTITNKQLAKVAGMHPNHMIRFFKNRTGITPAKYVTIQKMEYAKMLIEEKEYSIQEITEKIGLEHISHFSKLFKSYYGVSPAGYRKHMHIS